VANNGDSNEWWFVKQVKKKGLPQPIKRVLLTLIGKETKNVKE
jgi:hypothetical protein